MKASKQQRNANISVNRKVMRVKSQGGNAILRKLALIKRKRVAAKKRIGNVMPKKKKSTHITPVIMPPDTNVEKKFARLHEYFRPPPIPSNPVKSFLQTITAHQKLLVGRVVTIPYNIPLLTTPEPSLIATSTPLPETDSDEISSIDEAVKFSSEEEEEEEEETLRSVPEKTGEYQRIDIPGGSILVLYANSTISLNGMVDFTVLSGCIEIYGKTFQEDDVRHTMYSPRGSAFLCITNLSISRELGNDVRRVIRERLTRTGMDATKAMDLVHFKLKDTTALLHLMPPNRKKLMDFIEVNIDQRLMPTTTSDGLQAVFRNTTFSDWNVLRVNPTWTQLYNTIIDAEPNHSMFICGGKGVGKSTLLRYLVNRLLNTSEFVYVLDLDVGQPEFTIPGAISIIRVSQPLLGPNYTHLSETVKTLFVPSINVADPDDYLERVRLLVTHLPNDAPVLVNYMGYSRGLGSYLAAKVISCVRPKSVVQLYSTHESRNYPDDLTCEMVRNKSGTSLEYRFIKVASMSTGNGGELDAKRLREMMVLGYFSSCLPRNCMYLTERWVKIYTIALENIVLIYDGLPCSAGVLNANLAAMCEEEDGTSCVGWCIVRGVDQLRGRLFVITPVELSKLEKVRFLMAGSVRLPASFYTRQHPAVMGVLPYVAAYEEGPLAMLPKRQMVPKGSPSKCK